MNMLYFVHISENIRYIFREFEKICKIIQAQLEKLCKMILE